MSTIAVPSSRHSPRTTSSTSSTRNLGKTLIVDQDCTRAPRPADESPAQRPLRWRHSPSNAASIRCWCTFLARLWCRYATLFAFTATKKSSLSASNDVDASCASLVASSATGPSNAMPEEYTMLMPPRRFLAATARNSVTLPLRNTWSHHLSRCGSRSDGSPPHAPESLAVTITSSPSCWHSQVPSTAGSFNCPMYKSHRGGRTSATSYAFKKEAQEWREN
mmetsp:Transcript_10988/g.24640  ORF Transcript_10988/g.24640 Transcript_10988/m.24640 type:complete len:221 (-) Transcript_10988:732-1394(-)